MKKSKNNNLRERDKKRKETSMGVRRNNRTRKRSKFTSDTSSSFFKVMLGDFTQSLFIPPSFAKNITDLVDTSIFIKDSVEAQWKVKVCMKRKILAFGNGWYNFVSDHSITLGEFLVFKQIEKSVFSVQIFSTSGCERVHFCKAKKMPDPNKKKRERTSKSPKPIAAWKKRATWKKKGRTPTIQEVTRKEEKKERHTRTALRKLLMEDSADKDLLVDQEISIVTPISSLPNSECLAISNGSEKRSENEEGWRRRVKRIVKKR